MSRVSQSPAAQLLRSSRLFSLPPPLPKPTNAQQTSLGSLRGSPSATLPYPVQQAIVTPPSSRARGDWGLKRPLPLKSTNNTSTPAVRISSIDTIEQITEFQSAADHTRTLIKWQELNLPLSDVPARAMRVTMNNKPTNVFESTHDYTDKNQVQGKALSDDKRWKRKGPWLSGMTEKEFNTWVSGQLQARKQQFNAFMKEHIKAKRIAARRLEAQAEGTDFDESTLNLTKQDYNNDKKLLRENAGKGNLLGSEIAELVIRFLDLPPIKHDSLFSRSSTSSYTSHLDEWDADIENAPPTTHPSAGLSYLRTSAFIENHPVLGPQASHSPVPARVLKPRNHTALRSTPRAVLGVAGVVADDSDTGSLSGGARGEPGIGYLDYEAEGGRKIWVEPTTASIDSRGRIKLEVQRAAAPAIKIANGEMPGQLPVPKTPGLGAGRNGAPAAPRVNEPLDNAWGGRASRAGPTGNTPFPESLKASGRAQGDVRNGFEKHEAEGLKKKFEAAGLKL